MDKDKTLGDTQKLGETGMGDASDLSGVLTPFDRVRARRAVGRLEKAATKASAGVVRAEGQLLQACVGATEVDAQILEARERIRKLPETDPERGQLAERIVAAEKTAAENLASCAVVLRPKPRLGESAASGSGDVKREV